MDLTDFRPDMDMDCIVVGLYDGYFSSIWKIKGKGDESIPLYQHYPQPKEYNKLRFYIVQVSNGSKPL